MQLLLATENQGKKKELDELLADVGIKTITPNDLTSEKIVFPEESGTTFKENALIKTSFIYNKFHLPTLGDDSGLSISALNNFPGVNSARWLQGNDQDRNNGIIKKMGEVANRKAFFSCVLCLIVPNQEKPLYFEGQVSGTIATKISGDQGFGYDSIFIPKGETKTLAELGSSYKNKYSHRAIALLKLEKSVTQNMLH